MTATFDLDPQGRHRRQSRRRRRARHRHPRRAHRGDRRPRRGDGRRGDRRHAACTSCPASSTRQVHFREPGLEHKEDLETGSRARRAGRRHGRVRDAQHQAADDDRPRRSPTRCARARNRMFCDFAFYVGGTRENIADIPALEQLEGSAGIKVFMGSSTGDLLVDDEASLDRIIGAHLAPRRLPRRGRGPAEGAHGPAPRRRSVLASRCGATRKRR